MKNFENNVILPAEELDDSILETISGGYSAGDVVRIRKSRMEYCSGCGHLLANYEATITGVRGVLDGKTVYWITNNCCGRHTSVIETAIV